MSKQLLSSTIEEKVLSDHEQTEFWNEGGDNHMFIN